MGRWIYKKRSNGKALKSYILYMPTMLPHAQAQFRLGKVNGHPVKLSFGFGKPGEKIKQELFLV